MTRFLFYLLTGTIGVIVTATEIGINSADLGAKLGSHGGTGGSGRSLSLQNTKVWGPGLDAEFFLPVRYFYLQTVDTQGHNFTVSLGNKFTLKLSKDKGQNKVRAWTKVVDIGNGAYVFRYRLFEEVKDLTIEVTYGSGEHVANSPYHVKGPFFHEGCTCSEPDTSEWAQIMECKANYTQIDTDLAQWPEISLSDLSDQQRKKFGSHYQIGHYVIKDNRVYCKLIGDYTGLNRKFEDMLMSLMGKVYLPDMEFFVNLRDKPIEKTKMPMPIFSFGGSRDSADIALPSYELTNSILNAMHRADLDLQELMGQGTTPWEQKVPMGFWRGRDSREQRLDLCRLSKSYPDKVDAKLTQTLFFNHVSSLYGDIAPKVPFDKFFEYKYLISLDGMVAAFRVPFLLAGSSVLFKQDSFFYEHFYADIEPWVHYVPFNHNLNNLIQRINWAIDNDHLAHIISENSRHFIREQLRPQDVYCYMFRLFEKYAEKQTGTVSVKPGMHEITGKRICTTCPYNPLHKSEL